MVSDFVLAIGIALDTVSVSTFISVDQVNGSGDLVTLSLCEYMTQTLLSPIPPYYLKRLLRRKCIN